MNVFKQTKFNMKKLWVVTLLAALSFGCVKSNDSGSCTDVTPESEASTISSFCAANGITAQKDENGIFYQVIDPGTTPTPDLNDTISVLYTTKLLDGTILDDHQTTPYTGILNNFIDGWKLGIPKIAKGGQMKMVVPSSLCYGCYGYPGAVPSNAILYFDIKLVDVK